jgi:actin-related protein
MPMAGRDISEYLRGLLREKGVFLSTLADQEIVRDIKESLCYVVQDFDLALKESTESSACEK